MCFVSEVILTSAALPFPWKKWKNAFNRPSAEEVISDAHKE